jgi:Protein of unknown function (DUF3631)
LLADARTIFDERGDRLPSAALAEALHGVEESPWGEWFGKPISQHAIAKLLAAFDIRPGTVRIDKETTAKGYKREQFADAWTRYLPSENVTPSQPAPLGGKQPIAKRHTLHDVTDEKPPDPAWIGRCDGVTDEDARETNVDGFADVDEAYAYYRGKLAAAEAAERAG